MSKLQTVLKAYKVLESTTNEGTWSVPNTEEKMKELEQLMRKPIPAKKAADALYGLIGDDDLFDSIAEIERDDKDSDVRYLVAYHLEDWFKDLSTFRDEWDSKAVKIGKQLIKKYK